MTKATHQGSARGWWHERPRILLSLSRDEELLRVPEEIALLGYGNDAVTCELSPIELSSIDPARAELGRQAAQLLHGLMEGAPAPAAPLLIPPKGVIPRRSTDVLAVPDLVVARALRFIWDHLRQDLAIADAADAVGVPHRTLARRFRKALNRSMVAELLRKRLEEAQRLLRETDLSVADIAVETGFRSDDYLYRRFRSAFGLTPRRYRAGKSREFPSR